MPHRGLRQPCSAPHPHGTALIYGGNVLRALGPYRRDCDIAEALSYTVSLGIETGRPDARTLPSLPAPTSSPQGLMADWLLEQQNQALDLAAGAGREGTGLLESHQGGGSPLTTAPLSRILEGSQEQKRSPTIAGDEEDHGGCSHSGEWT